MDWTVIALLLVGLLLLVGGAELLVRGASRLAGSIGISPLVVGLTVVAFGTSAPELAVSVQSSLAGEPDLALGNVVGSNIFNVLLILGLSALFAPLVVAQRLVRLDVPMMIGVSVVVLVMALDGGVARWEGALLFGALLAHTTYLVRQGRRESAGERTAGSARRQAPAGGGSGPAGSGPEDGALPEAGAQPRAPSTEPRPSRGTTLLADIGRIVLGLAALVLGARWLVAGASGIAAAAGVSDLVIGLTVVAGGTSLPELATSVLASIRGERDIAVGNVVGSNVFNLLGVLGLAAVVSPAGIPVAPGAMMFDIPIMTAVAVACLPILGSGHVISRWEGAVFLGFYVAYVTYLVFHAVSHPLLPAFRASMLGFVLPLTAITLIVIGVRTVRAARRG